METPIQVNISGAEALRVVAQATGLEALGRWLGSKAERTERLTAAQTDIDVQKIQDGVAEFRAGNLRAIAEKAAPMLEARKKKGKVKPDWGMKWMESASLSTDETIQEMWARLLTGEAENPGKYSKWTLQAVSCMDKEDVRACEQMRESIWTYGRQERGVAARGHGELIRWPSSDAISPLNEYVLQRAGVATGFGSPLVSTLDSVEDWGGADGTHRIGLRYFDTAHVFDVPSKYWPDIPAGQARTLTLLGREIMTLCNGKPNKRYEQDCIAQWTNAGLKYVGSSDMRKK